MGEEGAVLLETRRLAQRSKRGPGSAEEIAVVGEKAEDDLLGRHRHPAVGHLGVVDGAYPVDELGFERGFAVQRFDGDDVGVETHGEQRVDGELIQPSLGTVPGDMTGLDRERLELVAREGAQRARRARRNPPGRRSR